MHLVKLLKFAVRILGTFAGLGIWQHLVHQRNAVAWSWIILAICLALKLHSIAESPDE